MSWAEFARFLHRTPDIDAHKITLLAVVVQASGQPDQRVDVDALMAALERSRDTVVQTLNRLSQGPSPWLYRSALLSPNNRPMIGWYTTKRIAG